MSKSLSLHLLLLPLISFCVFGNLDSPSSTLLGSWFISSASILKLVAVLASWSLAMFSIYALKDSCDAKCLKKSGRMFLVNAIIISVVVLLVSFLSNLTGNTSTHYSINQLLVFSLNTGFLISSTIIAFKSIYMLTK